MAVTSQNKVDGSLLSDLLHPWQTGSVYITLNLDEMRSDEINDMKATLLINQWFI